jgi:hypothetical protein
MSISFFFFADRNTVRIENPCNIPCRSVIAVGEFALLHYHFYLSNFRFSEPSYLALFSEFSNDTLSLQRNKKLHGKQSFADTIGAIHNRSYNFNASL